MSSRQEEKERRREERIAAEQAAAARDARRKRIGIGIGLLLALAAIAAVAIALTAGGGGSKKKHAKPAKVSTALQAKASAAGCTAQTFPMEGRGHTDAKVAYRTNPPTSGNHNPAPASDGIYDPGGTPPIGKLLHAMEHGRVEYQYKPGLPAGERTQLEALMKEPGLGNRPAGYNQLLFQNTTAMPYAVAGTAWTHWIVCPSFQGPKTIAALRAFRDEYTDKAPELIPSPE